MNQSEFKRFLKLAELIRQFHSPRPDEMIARIKQDAEKKSQTALANRVNASARGRLEIECIICGKSVLGLVLQKYCSKKCRRIGINENERLRRVLEKSRKGNS